jgi:preprotein translocase subunit SecB
MPMEQKNQYKPKISPEKYADILNGIDLISLYLKSSKCSVDPDDFEESSIQLRVQDDASFEINENKEVLVIHKYRLSAKKQNSRKRSLYIECEYCLRYSSNEAFSEEFFDIFKKINLPINSWPFFREYAHSMTARMNLPPLTLPLFKRNI